MCDPEDPYYAVPYENHPEMYRVIFIFNGFWVLPALEKEKSTCDFWSNCQLLVLERQKFCKGDLLTSIEEKKLIAYDSFRVSKWFKIKSNNIASHICSGPTNTTSIIGSYNQLAPQKEKREIVYQSRWSWGSYAVMGNGVIANPAAHKLLWHPLIQCNDLMISIQHRFKCIFEVNKIITLHIRKLS